jgi:maleylacetoacetate isomerase
MRLHADPRSSSSLRVLCYLRFKGIALTLVPVRLADDEQQAPAFVACNPSASVPALELDGDAAGTRWLTQSQAIVELLEARHPDPAALPRDELARARVRSLCALVACDIHPLSNLRVRRALAEQLGADAAAQWSRDWTLRGLASLEAWIEPQAGRFCHGDALTMADFFVAPAVLNAQRFRCDLAPFPVLRGLYERCLQHPAFEPMRLAA